MKTKTAKTVRASIPEPPRKPAESRRSAEVRDRAKPKPRKATRRTVARAFNAGASRERIAADVGESIAWVEERIRYASRKSAKPKPRARGKKGGKR